MDFRSFKYSVQLDADFERVRNLVEELNVRDLPPSSRTAEAASLPVEFIVIEHIEQRHIELGFRVVLLLL